MLCLRLYLTKSHSHFFTLETNQSNDSYSIVLYMPIFSQMDLVTVNMLEFIKQSYKNKVFDTMSQLKDWLNIFIVKKIYTELGMSITHHPIYMKNIKAHLYVSIVR